MADPYSSGAIDAFTPTQMAERVQTIGVAKSSMPAYQLVALGVMAGAFISLGAMNFITVAAQGLPRLVAALAFCLGLILVIVGGGELFTGNNLMAMAWAERKISTRAVFRNWGWVYLANLAGCLASVTLAYLSGMLHAVDMQFGVQALKIAATKTQLPWAEAFFKGILCNSLVCLAVWLCFAARTVTDRILAIIFPISAFVNMGFEHSIANMFFIPMGLLAMHDPAVVQAANLPPSVLATLGPAGFLGNLSAVTLGNMIGGTVLVAGMYYVVYLRNQVAREFSLKAPMFMQRRDVDGK